ncbi:MAG: hypothetical protein GTO02_17430 [Candidatus Dadabacteria bacterium]|nr:hypothetical protein [Candidatus Dadabacteria bacterium]
MQEEYGTKELFWIIKNGVKLSGMPSYGVTHSEDDIWSIVAFMKKFEDISKNDYKIMKKSVINMDYNHIHKDGKVHKH